MGWQDSVRSPEALLRAFGHDQAQHNISEPPVEGLPQMSVAISREAGALGTTVAVELGRRLGWAVYDHALLERMAAEMNVSIDLLESVDERHVGWLVERMEAFSAIPYVSENAYVGRLIETMLAIGARGQAVIVGRGAAHVLRPTTTLRVRLVADFDFRVRNLMTRAGAHSGRGHPADQSRRSRAAGVSQGSFPYRSGRSGELRPAGQYLPDAGGGLGRRDRIGPAGARATASQNARALGGVRAKSGPGPGLTLAPGDDGPFVTASGLDVYTPRVIQQRPDGPS